MTKPGSPTTFVVTIFLFKCLRRDLVARFVDIVKLYTYNCLDFLSSVSLHGVGNQKTRKGALTWRISTAKFVDYTSTTVSMKLIELSGDGSNCRWKTFVDLIWSPNIMADQKDGKFQKIVFRCVFPFVLLSIKYIHSVNDVFLC